MKTIKISTLVKRYKNKISVEDIMKALAKTEFKLNEDGTINRIYIFPDGFDIDLVEDRMDAYFCPGCGLNMLDENVSTHDDPPGDPDTDDYCETCLDEGRYE